MITLTERATGPVTLRAPVRGIVRFHAPPALCGELEMFEAGELPPVNEAQAFADQSRRRLRG